MRHLHGEKNFVQGTRSLGHMDFWSFRIEHLDTLGLAVVEVRITHLKLQSLHLKYFRCENRSFLGVRTEVFRMWKPESFRCVIQTSTVRPKVFRCSIRKLQRSTWPKLWVPRTKFFSLCNIHMVRFAALFLCNYSFITPWITILFVISVALEIIKKNNYLSKTVLIIHLKSSWCDSELCLQVVPVTTSSIQSATWEPDNLCPPFFQSFPYNARSR